MAFQVSGFEFRRSHLTGMVETGFAETRNPKRFVAAGIPHRHKNGESE
jgi:hypothetical protein